MGNVLAGLATFLFLFGLPLWFILSAYRKKLTSEARQRRVLRAHQRTKAQGDEGPGNA